MQFLRRSLVGAFLLAVTLGIMAFAGDKFYTALQDRLSREAFKRPVRERVVAVNVVPYELQTIAPVITAFGEVQSRRTLDLRASVSGRVAWLAEGFEDGARVGTDDLLLRINPKDAEAALDVAQTDLLEAQAELRDAERGLILARDELAAARDQADLRQAALQRQRDLQARGVGTEAAIETAALAEASAQQAVLSRRQAEAQAESRVDQAGNRLRRQQINVANAERDLADTELRAPFSGTLAEVAVTEGGLVSTNERLAQLVDPESLEVVFRLSTAQYARLLDEQGRLIPAAVTVSLDVAGLDLQAQGVLTRVGAAVGEGATGRQVFARLDSFAGFRPGDFVTVQVMEPELTRVAVLPAQALDSTGTVLVVGAEDRLEERQVELLRRQGDTVIVRGQQLRDAQVVAERSPLIGAGIRVRVLVPQAEAVAGAAPPAPAVPATIQLTDERRAKLIAFVEGNARMPAEAKQRVLAQLQAADVPVQVVERIESRMGG